MPIELSKIEELAPDQASLSAAAKLKKPGPWSLLGCDDAAGLIWGECQGSGSSPYRVMCSEADYGYKCTCPSRKFPCKHSLALMWMRADRFAPRGGPRRTALPGASGDDGADFETGAPEEIRTPDLCLRRATLYPAELRAPRS